MHVWNDVLYFDGYFVVFGLLCEHTLACVLHISIHKGQRVASGVFKSSVLAPWGGECRDGGRNAADLHVGEGAPSLAAAVGDRRGRDDVLQPVEGDDEQRQQEHQQAEEEPHVHVNVALMAGRGGSRRHGGRRRGQTEESLVVHRSDFGLILVQQKNVHPWHPGWPANRERKKGRRELLQNEQKPTKRQH